MHSKMIEMKTMRSQKSQLVSWLCQFKRMVHRLQVD